MDVLAHHHRPVRHELLARAAAALGHGREAVAVHLSAELHGGRADLGASWLHLGVSRRISTVSWRISAVSRLHLGTSICELYVSIESVFAQ